MIWVLHLELKTLAVHRPGAEPRVLTADETIEGDDVPPGFACRVGDFFQ
jgi:hypothetical protein